MTRKSAFFVLSLMVSFANLGCTGSDGKDGATGQTGPDGENGEPGADGKTGATGETGAMGADGMDGAVGEPGADAVVPDGTVNTSCLSPCHGFNGVVEQWKSSTHFASFIANLGGEEVETWTGQRACGNCHAIDGIEQRLAGNVLYAGTASPTNVAAGQLNYKNSGTSAIAEASYGGHAKVAVVHCTTCHDSSPDNDPHLTGKDYSVGSFPLRVPFGADDTAIIERSSAVGISDGTEVNYGKGNACIWCHKSRKDVTNYITASNKTSTNWGPHEGPHADVYTGKGGYEYSGQTYGGGTHQLAEDGCVNCHMPSVGSNQNVGDHSFYPQLSACKTCHAGATSFNILNAQTRTTKGLQVLRGTLNARNLLSRDGLGPLDAAALADVHFEEDKALTASNVPADTAGALYNYLLIARGGALGVHNASYTSQLIYDSVKALGGDLSDLER